MNNLYKNSIYLILLAFSASFALLPSYGKLSPDLLIYMLILIEIVALLFLSVERKRFFKDIKTFCLRIEYSYLYFY